jgi:hypothetical protein
MIHIPIKGVHFYEQGWAVTITLSRHPVKEQNGKKGFKVLQGHGAEKRTK